ncbi:MAG: gluconate 2-dehydrogenase subunit 3 family protein, partial [Anaerolineales bacterium]
MIASFLSERERQTLTMIIDTLLPQLSPAAGDDPALFRLSAVELGVPDLAIAALESATNPKSQAELKQFLGALDTPALNRLAAGHGGRFAALSLEARADILRAWGNS